MDFFKNKFAAMAVFVATTCFVLWFAYQWKQTIPLKPRQEAERHIEQGHIVNLGEENLSSVDQVPHSIAAATPEYFSGCLEDNVFAAFSLPFRPGERDTSKTAEVDDGTFTPLPNPEILLPEDGPNFPEPDDEVLGLIVEHDLVEMAAFQTHFIHAMPSQAKNIQLAASRLNYRWIQPGEVFSYNKAAGPFDKANGYGEGIMFSGNRLVPSVGGGVCQVASTLYNIVLRANLTIVERHPHSMTVPYVQPGRDATVVYGVLDFKFRNDLDKPLLLTAGHHNDWVWIRLYGPSKPAPVRLATEILSRQERSVERIPDTTLPPGEEIEVAPGKDGIEVQTWKFVETASGEERIDLGVDRYKPSPRIIHYGPE